MYHTIKFNTSLQYILFVSKKKIRRLTKSQRFMHVVCVRLYILPNQLRDFHENSVKMIPLRAAVLSVS